jgi:hypothetical protein
VSIAMRSSQNISMRAIREKEANASNAVWIFP